MLNDRTMDRYLHAILALGSRFLIVRAVDVAAYLGYSKASVSVAVKQMLREELVSVGSHGALILTPEGGRRADAFHERYDFFYRLLTGAGVNEDIAKQEAGSIAGSLSSASLNALRRKLLRTEAQP